jgi:hypothetical protein
MYKDMFNINAKCLEENILSIYTEMKIKYLDGSGDYVKYKILDEKKFLLCRLKYDF